MGEGVLYVAASALRVCTKHHLPAVAFPFWSPWGLSMIPGHHAHSWATRIPSLKDTLRRWPFTFLLTVRSFPAPQARRRPVSTCPTTGVRVGSAPCSLGPAVRAAHTLPCLPVSGLQLCSVTQSAGLARTVPSRPRRSPTRLRTRLSGSVSNAVGSCAGLDLTRDHWGRADLRDAGRAFPSVSTAARSACLHLL